VVKSEIPGKIQVQVGIRKSLPFDFENLSESIPENKIEKALISLMSIRKAFNVAA
jgi:hypothetical protein